MCRASVGFLCCALLISLFVATNLVGAAPLTRVGPNGDLSDAWKHKWLAGTMTFSVSPPEDLTEMQRAEWSIGNIVGVAELCGDNGIARKVYDFMIASPYFKKGLMDMRGYDFARDCGSHTTPLQKLLGQKKEWAQYLRATYPDGAVLPEPPGKLSTEEQERPYCRNRMGGQC